jgi:hypothetical protein
MKSDSGFLDITGWRDHSQKRQTRATEGRTDADNQSKTVASSYWPYATRHIWCRKRLSFANYFPRCGSLVVASALADALLDSAMVLHLRVGAVREHPVRTRCR